jgi:ferritin-like protein
MSTLSISAIDADGAIQKAEDLVAGDTRAAFFRRAALGGGAVLGSGAFLGMLPELAAARPSKAQDLKILNYALTLEYREAAFYKGAVASGAVRGDALEFARLVFDHETTHVTALRKTIRSLGGKPVKSPRFDFKGSNGDQATFLATAFVLENTGVRAYLGQAGRLRARRCWAPRLPSSRLRRGTPAPSPCCSRRAPTRAGSRSRRAARSTAPRQ